MQCGGGEGEGPVESEEGERLGLDLLRFKDIGLLVYMK